jgi:hypothetical protein
MRFWISAPEKPSNAAESWMFKFEFVQWASNQLCFLGYMYQKNVTNHTNMSDDLFV